MPGNLDYKALRKEIKAGGGKSTLKTVQGGTLIAMMNGDESIVLKDEKGNVANISTYNVRQSNGVIQVIDHVLMPK